jgi:hypothetical protein
MVACHSSRKLANRWIAGKEISNAEIRRVLDQHPMGESEKSTPEFYSFFSRAAHPNRKTMFGRSLGDGNEFVLGSIGRPSLAMLADYALKTLDLWFWFGAFVAFVYRRTLYEADANFKSGYDAAVKMAREVSPWLVEQFNRTLAQERNHMDRNEPVPPSGKR